MGFQTRQIRTGKLQHKRWDGKCKGCFCFSWLLCPNDGLNLYSTPIVWMYEAVFASSSYSVPSSVKFSWMSAGFCLLLFSSQPSGHLLRWWQGCIFCIFVFYLKNFAWLLLKFWSLVHLDTSCEVVMNVGGRFPEQLATLPIVNFSAAE